MAIPHIDEIVPEGPIRIWIYRVFAVLGALLILTQIGFAAAQAGQPVWLTVSLAIYAGLASAGFTKAQANVPLYREHGR